MIFFLIYLLITMLLNLELNKFQSNKKMDGIGLGNFKEIANKLLKRQLTGHAARDKIKKL